MHSLQLLSACSRAGTLQKFWADLPNHMCFQFQVHSVSCILQEGSDPLHKLCLFFPWKHRFPPFLMCTAMIFHPAGLTRCFQGVELTAQVLHCTSVSIAIRIYCRNPKCCVSHLAEALATRNSSSRNRALSRYCMDGLEIREGRNTSNQLCCLRKCS